MDARPRTTASPTLPPGPGHNGTAIHTTHGDDRVLFMRDTDTAGSGHLNVTATDSRPPSHPVEVHNGRERRPVVSNPPGGTPAACRPDRDTTESVSVHEEPPRLSADSVRLTHQRTWLDSAAIGESRPSSLTARSVPRRSSPGAQQPCATSPHNGARTTASDIVAGLALPALRSRATELVHPLPLTELHRLPRDTSVLYGIGRVDASGRVSERQIVNALGWTPGERLNVALIAHGLVIHTAQDGPLTLSPTRRLVIPLTARRHCDIETGDHVLLAAAPEHGVVIVHPLASLDDMLVQYHAPTHPPHDHEQP